MKARFINELTVGTRVDATFALQSKELRVARNGDAYLKLVLSDRSGSIPAVLFRPNRHATVIPVGAVAHARGSVTTYAGRRRVTLEVLEPAAEFDSADLISTCTRPVAELEEELRLVVRSVVDREMRSILHCVFGDKAFFARFRECPASTSAHHSCLHGLLEHTVAVASACGQVAARYEDIDEALLLTAALLHDIGVVDELEWGSSITVTEEGRLVGHATLGAWRVREAAAARRIARRRALLLEHAILSHHDDPHVFGDLAPSTLEAFVLSRADLLDSDVSGFRTAVSAAARVDEPWTENGNVFGRALFAGRVEVSETPVKTAALRSA